MYSSDAFQKSKVQLSNARLLIFLKLDKEFHFKTDASIFGLGAVLVYRKIKLTSLLPHIPLVKVFRKMERITASLKWKYW